MEPHQWPRKKAGVWDQREDKCFTFLFDWPIYSVGRKEQKIQFALSRFSKVLNLLFALAGVYVCFISQ